MEDLQIKIMWAINTIRDQLQFGLDPLSAAKARERRAKGVLLDCHKKLESFQSENSELKSENQELKEKVKDIESLTKSMNSAIKDRNDTMLHNVAQSMRIQEMKSKVQELESQIEKMKTCDNCSSNCRKRAYYHILNCPDWKFRG